MFSSTFQGFATSSSSVLCCSISSSFLFLQQSLNLSPLSHPLSHCTAWLAGWQTDTAELLLHTSSLWLLLPPSPLDAALPPLTGHPAIAPYRPAMQPAVSNKPGDCLITATSALHLSAGLKASFIGLFIFPPSLSFSCAEVELLTYSGSHCRAETSCSTLWRIDTQLPLKHVSFNSSDNIIHNTKKCVSCNYMTEVVPLCIHTLHHPCGHL